MQETLQFLLSKGKLSEVSAAILFLGFICLLVAQPELAESSISWKDPVYSNRHLELSAVVL